MASAQSTVMVSIPAGAGAGPSAAPGYAPDVITVVIGVNNTVTWTNNDPIHHTVTSTAGNGSISSGDMAQGVTFTYTFSTPGTYNYLCVYHAWMTGTVIVLAASTSTSSSSSTHTTPEFPAAWLALVLFAAIAAVVLVSSRLRPMLSTRASGAPTTGI